MTGSWLARTSRRISYRRRREEAALHWGLDLMWQQATSAFVGHQNERLREAAEAEPKYLSFLSHALSGNLGNVTLWLQILRKRLGNAPQYAMEVSALDTAQQSIPDTMGGMGRLLQAEQKRLMIALDVPDGATVRTDGELLRLVLQNLIGNAIKYTDGGSVRLRAEQSDAREGGWVLSVADDGPGIAPEHLGHIFDAFRHGDVQGQSGVGLGLTIASRAAKLLNAALTVDSAPGKGSTFRLVLPSATA